MPQAAFIVMLDTTLETSPPLTIADDILDDLSTQGYAIIYVRPWGQGDPSLTPLGAPAPQTPQAVTLPTIPLQ